MKKTKTYRMRLKVSEYLATKKIRVLPQQKYVGALVEIAERELGLKKPQPGQPYSSTKGRLKRVLRAIDGSPMPTKRRAVSKDRVASFYKSADWARARYDALAKSSGQCELCGRSKHDGAILHVDHIKNLREFWELRLAPDNHQVLCMTCNWGKGNRSEEDWREPRLATLMGEAID